jgi:hypothetical protein
MRVTVAYTVDLEDVPSEVYRLLDGVDSGLTACAVVSSTIQQCDGISDTLINEMVLLQERIATIQSTLEDAKGIARGYLATISKPPGEALGEMNHDNLD